MSIPEDLLPEVESSLQEHNCELIGQVGVGASAVVYKVRDVRYPTSYFVAKVLRRANESDSIIDNTEFATLISLSHPNILPLYAMWASDHFHFIVLEYAPGGSLSDFLENSGALPLPAFRAAARQLLEALAYCHSLSVFHGDIKPANILLDAYGRVRLADFGFGGRAERGEPLQIRGSLPYMSPELVRGRATNAFANDIWALGVTFFELVTGRLPWSTQNKGEAIREIASGRVVFPPDMDPKLGVALGRAFDVNPKARATAEQLLLMPAFAQVDSKRPFGPGVSVLAASAILSRTGSRLLGRGGKQGSFAALPRRRSSVGAESSSSRRPTLDQIRSDDYP
jgi:serine/threonine protein kinase